MKDKKDIYGISVADLDVEIQKKENIDFNQKVEGMSKNNQKIIEAFAKTYPRAVLHEGSIYFRDADVKKFISTQESEINKKWEKKTITIRKGKTHSLHDKCENCYELSREKFNTQWRKKIEKMKRNIEHPTLRWKGKICDACSGDFIYNQALLDVLKEL